MSSSGYSSPRVFPFLEAMSVCPDFTEGIDDKSKSCSTVCICPVKLLNVFHMHIPKAVQRTQLLGAYIIKTKSFFK